MFLFMTHGVHVHEPRFRCRFYDMGHRVIGVELVEQAIRDFFREQQLTMVEDVWPEAKSKVFTV